MARRTTAHLLTACPSTACSSRAHPFEEALARAWQQPCGGSIVDVGAEAAFQQQPATLAFEPWLFRPGLEQRQPCIDLSGCRALIAEDGRAAPQLRQRHDPGRGGWRS